MSGDAHLGPLGGSELAGRDLSGRKQVWGLPLKLARWRCGSGFASDSGPADGPQPS